MKYSFSSIGMLLFGLMSFVVILVFQDITVNNEADYYSLKEAMEASLYEAIDIAYFRNTSSDDSYGEIKIIEEKFVANFTRRFLNNTMGNSKGYVIEFYDIMEKPPKASVVIKNGTNGMIITGGNNLDVINNLTGIIEAKVSKSVSDSVCNEGILKTGDYKREYISYVEVTKGNLYQFYKLNVETVKNEIGIGNINSIWINNIEFGPNDILSQYEISPAMQSASYLAQRAVDSADVPVNLWNVVNGTSTNKTTYSSSCSTTYRTIPSFDINIIDSDGSVYGAPVIRILKSIPNDLSVDMCTQIFTYRIKWGYSYCSSG